MTNPPICIDEPVGGDGLIDPEHFIIPADSMWTAASQIEASGEWLTRMGDDLAAAMDAISAEWWKLPGCYSSPEASEAYFLLKPASDDAALVRERLISATFHLELYAEAVSAEREAMRDLSTRAAVFRREVVDGVTIRRADSADATVWDVLDVFDPDMVTVPWNEDGATRDRNQALLEEHAAIAHRIHEAAVTCANAINALVDTLPAEFVAPAVVPEWALASADIPMPWGYPAEENRNFYEQSWHAVWRFGNEAGTSISALTGYDTLTDERTAEYRQQAWAGVGDFLGSAVLSLAFAADLVEARRVAAGQRTPYQHWLVDRGDVMTGGVAGLASIDYGAGPGDAMFQTWQDEPWEAGTYTALNVATFFAGFGALSAGRAAMRAAAAGAMGARTARLVSMSANIAEMATSPVESLVGGGIRLTRRLLTAIHRGDPNNVDITPSGVADDFERVTGAGSVSDDVFGSERPGVGESRPGSGAEPESPSNPHGDGDPGDPRTEVGEGGDESGPSDAPPADEPELGTRPDTDGALTSESDGPIQAANRLAQYPGFEGLQVHEDLGGHAMKRHVGRTEAQLRLRFETQAGLEASSTFVSLEDADRFTSAVLQINSGVIDDWIDTGFKPRTLVLRHTFSEHVGLVAMRDSFGLAPTDTVRVVLRPDATASSGWKIVTSYPLARSLK